MSFISFRIGNFVPCIAVKKNSFFCLLTISHTVVYFWGQKFQYLYRTDDGSHLCVNKLWTCDVFLCKKTNKGFVLCICWSHNKNVKNKKKSLIIFVHGLTNVPFGLEDIWVGFMRSRNAWDNETTQFPGNTCTCIYLGPSMYKHELYYVDHFLHMYDVSDRKTTHMNCKHVYPFPRLVYYRVCFDNILKSDCI